MIADRIRLARQKAGFSLRALAAAMDHRVTAQAIGKYERGEDVPSSGVLHTLCRALGVSLEYLLDAQGMVFSGVEFRTAANTTAKDKADVQVAVMESLDRYVRIESVLELTTAQWSPPVAPRRLAAVHDAEALADEVRHAWQLGLTPIANLTDLLEEKGLKLLILPLPMRVSGVTCVARIEHGAALPVVVVNRQFSLERRRLTAAHELAHCLIDTHALPDKEEEKAATLFAGALLMPRDHLLQEVGKHRTALGYDEVMTLKKLYRVSGAALLMRLRHLGVIEEATLTYLWQTLARGWRTQEPEELEPPQHRGQYEQAMRFQRLCYRALAEGLLSVQATAELLQRDPAEVVAGLKGPQAPDAPSRA